MEPVEVTARFDTEGKISPTGFTRQGHAYPVISIGRRWSSSEGQHILVMVPGDQIFELVFNPSTGIWHLSKLGKEHLVA